MADMITKEFKGASTYDILAWHRPIASGIVLGSIVAVWLIFVCFDYTITTFAARIVQLLFLLGGAAAVTKRACVSSSDVTSCMDKMYEKVRPCTQKCAQRLFDAITWRDFILSSKVFIGCFVVAYIGNWISDAVLLLLVVLGAFSLPVVYEKKKTEIDAQLSKIQSIIDKYLGMLKTKGESAKTTIQEAKDEAEAEFAKRKEQ